MASKKELTKDVKVSKEVKRLRKIFENMPKDSIDMVEGLIIEAAELRIRLEDIRTDLDINGYDEMFTQSENVAPYERERPQARRYVALNKSYQSIIKQLSDHLPKGERQLAEDDGFADFVNSRY